MIRRRFNFNVAKIISLIALSLTLLLSQAIASTHSHDHDHNHEHSHNSAHHNDTDPKPFILCEVCTSAITDEYEYGFDQNSEGGDDPLWPFRQTLHVVSEQNQDYWYQAGHFEAPTRKARQIRPRAPPVLT